MRRAVDKFSHGIMALCCLSAPAAASGPDLVVGDLTAITRWGTIGGVTAYSIGTTSCNLGTDPLSFIQATNQHPVIAQNMYRLKNGRFEQLGMSWLKHGYCALQSNICTTCSPYCTGCCDHLGVGCSDPYSSAANGEQAGLGPRSEVNALTGAFPFPFTTHGQTGDALYKRLRVSNGDLDPGLNAGALYFAEGHYVSSDDATAGNGANNASYRRFTVGALQSGGYNLLLAGSTMRTRSAIQAWRDTDAGVALVDLPIPAEGLFILGWKVSDNGDGTWHFEYAVQNLNSDRSGLSFSVPVPDGVALTNVGFHDVDYHSGEPYTNTDWAATRSAGAITWATESYTQNQNASALRWATLYNFRFDANSPPMAGGIAVTLGLFKPGTPASIAAAGVGAPEIRPCPADFNGDATVNVADFFAYLAGFAAADPRCDENGDGSVNVADFLGFLALYSAGCP
jgi:hypothetical protein